jgi:hypothetical protein
LLPSETTEAVTCGTCLLIASAIAAKLWPVTLMAVLGLVTPSMLN